MKPDSPDGYRLLSGNEVGAILGWRAAEIAAQDEALVEQRNGEGDDEEHDGDG